MRRWEHEGISEKIQVAMDQLPEALTIGAQTVEHPFGKLKLWMGARHFLMKRLENVKTGMILHVLAYNIRRMITIVGVPTLIKIVGGLSISFYQLWAPLKRILTADNHAIAQNSFRKTVSLGFVGKLAYASS